MLLRIIDCPSSSGETAIKVLFESDNEDIQCIECFNPVSNALERVPKVDDLSVNCFQTDSFHSPMTRNFRQLLQQYFNRFSSHPLEMSEQSSLSSKLIKIGQNLGEEWLGEDHQLLKFLKDIENCGYPNLTVSLESHRTSFFDEWWETAILYESNYILSSITKGFIRQFNISGIKHNYSDLSFELTGNTTSTTNADSTNEASPDIDTIQSNCLNVTSLISRHELSESSSESSYFQHFLKEIANEDAIDYRLIKASSREKIINLLENTDCHILTLDGPFLVQPQVEGNTTNSDEESLLSDNIHFVCDDGSLINLKSLIQVMVKQGVPLLCIDARAYRGVQDVSALTMLSNIAQCAQMNGLGNVIGLNELVEPELSLPCFAEVFSQLKKGHTLQRAVVEARKTLQSVINETQDGVPFLNWPLLSHFSKQEILFFDGPIENKAQEDPFAQTPNLERYHKHLFGYRTDMLTPLLNQVNDGQIIDLLNLLHFDNEKSGSASIIGADGTGKTQLSHAVSIYLAQQGHVDYGFYFDYASDHYFSSDIMQMIAPVLLKNNDDHEKVNSTQTTHLFSALKEKSALFIFDLSRVLSGVSITELTRDLVPFILQLKVTGQAILLIDKRSDGEFRPLHNIMESALEINPLSDNVIEKIVLQQLRLLGLEQPAINNNSSQSALLQLFNALNGNPWLAKKAATQFAIGDFDALINQLGTIENEQKHSVITQYYEWQWNALEPAHQTLLLLMSDVNGLLLEMFMIAFDQPTETAPVSSLKKLLNNDTLKFSEIIERWEYSGFLTRYPHGRFVDNRAHSFLNHKRSNRDLADELLFCFSQVLCDGMRLLITHVLKQPNPSITNNLIINRRHWVKHFEALWFGHDYRGFMAVKNSFESLLQQVQLTDEVKKWSLDLIKRTELPIDNCTQIEPSQDLDDASLKYLEKHIGWLSLASSIVNQEKSDDIPQIAEGIQHWSHWFKELEVSLNKKEMALFQPVLTFLETYYVSQFNWLTCIELNQIALDIYTKHKAWPRVIQVLKMLSRCNSEIGESNEAIRYETILLDDISYDGSPPGYQLQQMVDTLLVRLTRKDINNTKILLERIREQDSEGQYEDMLEGVQCDLYYLEGQFEKCLPYYEKIWPKVMASKQEQQIFQLNGRLMEIQNAVGLGDFARHFKYELSPSVIH